MRTSTETTNEAATRSDASPPATRRRGLPANMRATAPARGNAGTSQIRSVTPPSPMRCAAPRSPMSPSEQVDVVHAGGYPASEDGHDDRESNHNFSGCNHHGEERQDLTIDLAELAGETDPRQVDRGQLGP